MKMKVLVGGSLLLSCLMSVSAFAQAQTCSVTTQNGNGARFYVPSGGDGKYNIIAWGNGTGGGATTYTGLLTAAAQRCVLIAAATTANSGGGTEVASALSQARSRFANILNTGANLKIATSGHSQGGGGAFNSANVIGSAVSSVIAVLPDTVFTVTIQRPVAANVDVTCIFARSDTLAPAQPNNLNNCRRNATIFRTVSVAGNHFAPVNGTGGAVGQAMRDQIARLGL